MNNKKTKNGYAEIDDDIIRDVRDAYFEWKHLNELISDIGSRGINMPDAISEPIGCYCFDLMWNKGKIAGDATDRNGRTIEFKSTSRFDRDLSSFGPKETFDDLVFLRFDIEHDLVYAYDLDIDYDGFGELKANKKQTIREQREQGRRPHVSLLNLLIKRDDGSEITPTLIFDISSLDIEKCV